MASLQSGGSEAGFKQICLEEKLYRVPKKITPHDHGTGLRRGTIKLLAVSICRKVAEAKGIRRPFAGTRRSDKDFDHKI